ncbi:MAG: FIVAR domain-containing protein [Spirochaetaceae bacterium]|nr:FIVAR domain-containing protein [Spirochaetaceae bacterium]
MKKGFFVCALRAIALLLVLALTACHIRGGGSTLRAEAELSEASTLGGIPISIDGTEDGSLIAEATTASVVIHADGRAAAEFIPVASAGAKLSALANGGSEPAEADFLAIAASYDFSTNTSLWVKVLSENGKVTHYYKIAVTVSNATVSSVTVIPATADVQIGKTRQFTATVNGTADPPQTVTWTVTGQSKNGTSIDNTGLLTVAANETAEASLTVKATSTFDTTKSGTATVTVKTEPVPTDKTTLAIAIGNATAAKTGITIKPAGTTPADVAAGAYYWLQADVDTLTAAITAAQAVAGNADATQEQVDGAVTTLNAALTAFNNAKKEGTKVSGPDYTALTAKIEDATAAKTGITIKPAGTVPADVADGTYYWLQADVDTLSAAITAAQAVADDTDATQGEVDGAVITLNAAITAFNNARKTGTKVDYTALNTKISDANTAKTGITIKPAGTTPAEVEDGTEYWLQADVDTLTAAITAAQAVADNTGATQSQVDGAVTTLNAALTAFTDAKKTGTLVITNAANPVIGTQPAATGSYTLGRLVTLTVAASASTTGYTGTDVLSYQWYQSTDNANNTSGDDTRVGTNSTQYRPSTEASGTSYYYVEVTNTNDAVNGTKTAMTTSTVATVTVTEPEPLSGGITITSGISGSDFPGDAVVTGSAVSLDISEGGTATISYTGDDADEIEWRVDGVEIPSFADATSKTFTAVYVKTATDYDKLTKGSHIVTLIITIDDKRYSKTISLTVTE